MMIAYDEAIDILRREGAARSLDCENVPLAEINGRIAAGRVTAPIANQPFDNSAMDGFAVDAKSLSGASEDTPVTLQVIGRIAAGNPSPSTPPAAGECYEIMTGAPMPPGCDAVVPVEQVRRDADRIVFSAQPKRHDNVRHAGEDFAVGQPVIEKGQSLGTQHILPLATLGIGHVDVLRKPKVALLSTGLEVVDDLNAPLQAGQIYNSTGPYVLNALPEFGVDAHSYGTVADDAAVFREKLAAMISDRADIILTTGAVSAGAYDFIRGELEAAGAEILFHKVKIRPGKPVLFAKFPNGGPLFVGLPGNPVASAAGLRFFVYPLIRALLGLPPEQPQRAILKNTYKKKAGFRFFLRAITSCNEKGALEVQIMDKQQSFMVSPFVSANGWAVAPEDTDIMQAGDLVTVYSLQPFK